MSLVCECVCLCDTVCLGVIVRGSICVNCVCVKVWVNISKLVACVCVYVCLSVCLKHVCVCVCEYVCVSVWLAGQGSLVRGRPLEVRQRVSSPSFAGLSRYTHHYPAVT